jgi:hypothetical protein
MDKARLRSALFGLFFGAFLGGVLGALLLGLLTYLDDSSSFFGSARGWTYIATLIGLIGGCVIGSIQGVLIGALQADRRSSVIIGTIMGMLLAASRFTGGENTYIPASTGLFALGMIAFCQILSLFISNVLLRQYRE